VYKPRQHLSVDEAMIHFKGRHHAVQYMPMKPIKWGFKVWVCAEAASGYALQVDVYSGKLAVPERAAARKRLGLGYDVVNEITRMYQQKNHIITYDRFFSSVHLAEHLLAQQTYIISTVKLDHKLLPRDFKLVKLTKKNPDPMVEMQRGIIVLRYCSLTIFGRVYYTSLYLSCLLRFIISSVGSYLGFEIIRSLKNVTVMT